MAGGGAVPDSLLKLLLEKAKQAIETDAYGPRQPGVAADEEIAFHAARALSLLSSHGANQRKIVAHGGLPIMYALARLADPDIQAEAATVIANVTSTVYDAQIQVCNDNILQLLLYLSASEFREVQAAATRAIANLTQSIDCEPAIRASRATDQLFKLYKTGSSDVKWQVLMPLLHTHPLSLRPLQFAPAQVVSD